VEEGELEFDKVTLLLRYKGPVSIGSRVARVAKVLEGLLKVHGKLGATDLTRHARKNKDDVREARELLVSTGRVLETQVGQSKFYELNPTSIAPSPVTASGVEPSPVVVASSPYMGEATAQLSPRASTGRCSKCYSKGEPPFVFLGIGILMCWDCIEVIDAWSETSVSLNDESKDSDPGEVIREF
jgi:hypothetical protein